MSTTTDRPTPIDTRTKLVGLLGRPLGHSFSPAMHNRAFKALELNYCYLPIEVAGRDLATVAAGIARRAGPGHGGAVIRRALVALLLVVFTVTRPKGIIGEERQVSRF